MQLSGGHRRSRGPGWIAVAIVALCCGGCGGDTAIVLAVSGSKVDALQFELAVEQSGSYVLDEEVSGMRVDVAGRDLQAQPYELLLREPDGSVDEPLALRALVLGIHHKDGKQGSSEEITSIGFTEPPQKFVRGEALRRSVKLVSLDGDHKLQRSGGCYSVEIKDGDKTTTLHLASNTDRDCDGVTSDRDCDDSDSAVYPGAPELCDGKDNNCDKKLASGDVTCYGRKSKDGPCFLGKRSCQEAQGKSSSGPCRLTGDWVPTAYCDAYESCSKLADPRSCLEKKVELKKLKCKLSVQQSGAACSGSSVELVPPVKTQKCNWKLIDKGGFRAYISQLGCNSELFVEANKTGAYQGTVIIEFFDGTKSGWVFEYTVSAEPVASCPSGDALSCSASP